MRDFYGRNSSKYVAAKSSFWFFLALLDRWPSNGNGMGSLASGTWAYCRA
jgi:hypothetical protein